MNTIKSNKKEERRLQVLGHIVHGYVSSAAPIGSKIVAQRMGGSVSSATIRNIMAELEDQGYIEQPHTSAGRIPTDSGYRTYVDAVQDRMRVEKREAQRLASEYSKRVRTIKEVIEKTSFLISHELHKAGVVMWPSIEDFYLKHLELVKVKAETVLAVLVTMTNAVKNFVIKLDGDINRSELERIANYINSNYEQEACSRIAEGLKHRLAEGTAEENSDVIKVAGAALSIIDTIVDENIENEIYWEGLNYFMDRKEFMDIDVARDILEMFSEKEALIRLMRKELPYDGLKVYIGAENDHDKMRGCSLITSGYSMHGRTVGRIGVIGPTRMDYDRALRTISCLSDLISMKLMEFET